MRKSINDKALEVQGRFFEALDLAIELGRYDSLQDFCNQHDFNRTKYSWIRSYLGKPLEEMRYKMIDIDALTAIVVDFNVSADWLLTGRGKMLKKD